MESDIFFLSSEFVISDNALMNGLAEAAIS